MSMKSAALWRIWCIVMIVGWLLGCNGLENTLEMLAQASDPSPFFWSYHGITCIANARFPGAKPSPRRYYMDRAKIVHHFKGIKSDSFTLHVLAKLYHRASLFMDPTSMVLLV